MSSPLDSGLDGRLFSKGEGDSGFWRMGESFLDMGGGVGECTGVEAPEERGVMARGLWTIGGHLGLGSALCLYMGLAVEG